jgi:hypothetical protein
MLGPRTYFATGESFPSYAPNYSYCGHTTQSPGLRRTFGHQPNYQKDCGNSEQKAHQQTRRELPNQLYNSVHIAFEQLALTTSAATRGQ